MNRYAISVQSSGVDLGVYEGDTEDGAIDAMARDAGYADYRVMCAITDPEDLNARVEAQRADLIVSLEQK